MIPLDPQKLPVHLAVIMDGNGRWAQQRMLKRIVGHQRGAETVKMVVEQAHLLGIRFLTLFAFSSENWSRPVMEVRALMTLLKKYIRQETARMMRKNIRYNVIGNRRDLPDDVNETLDEAIRITAANTGMVLTLALSYGGRQELCRAAAHIAEDAVAGKLSPRYEIVAGGAGFPGPAHRRPRGRRRPAGGRNRGAVQPGFPHPAGRSDLRPGVRGLEAGGRAIPKKHGTRHSAKIA